MQFNTTSIGGSTDRKHYPNSPVRANTGFNLVRSGGNNLDITITATQPNIDIYNILTGYLYFRNNRTIEIEVANLNSINLGVAVPTLEGLRPNNPCLMSFPARITYTYDFDITNNARTILDNYLQYLMNYYFGSLSAGARTLTTRSGLNLLYRLLRDKNHGIPTFNNSSTANSIEAQILNGDLGIYFDLSLIHI